MTEYKFTDLRLRMFLTRPYVKEQAKKHRLSVQRFVRQIEAISGARVVIVKGDR